jgi:glycerol-3-phosphate cytidylyltransferase-like family protein
MEEVQIVILGKTIEEANSKLKKLSGARARILEVKRDYGNYYAVILQTSK